MTFDAGRILPPEDGFSLTSMLLQVTFTALILGAEAVVVLAGVRRGIERVSTVERNNRARSLVFSKHC
jgi:hypothetical protein